MESSEGGPPPTVMASPGGIRDEALLELVPRKPALNEIPSPGKHILVAVYMRKVMLSPECFLSSLITRTFCKRFFRNKKK